LSAAAVLHEALRRGKSIPEDLQIIGYDDIPLSKLLYPPLSTIRQPAYDMGREAAKLLIKIIEKQPMTEKNIQMPVAFIERETTRRVEKDGYNDCNRKFVYRFSCNRFKASNERRNNSW